MIKRFKQIKNVGAFRNFQNGGSVQFKKLTFIYGLNTRGKTTLTDILCSLHDDDPDIVSQRRSIPETTFSQTISISVKRDGSETEESCRYINGRWMEDNFRDTMHIFGSEFIHENLFTGLSFQRQNKENLTQFILGQEGVKLANQIADDKKLLRQKNGSIRSFVPLHVQNRDDEEIQAFLKLDPNDIDLGGSSHKLTVLQEKLRQEKQRIAKPSEILSVDDFPVIEVPENSIDSLVTRTRNLLNREYKEISSKALKYIKSHLHQNFEIKDNAERWINEGLNSKSATSDNCVFCGQPLSNAAELMDAYHVYFNDTYREFISEISTEISQLTKKWQGVAINTIGGIQSYQNLLRRYQSLINTSAFNGLVTEFSRLADIKLEQDLNEIIRDLSSILLDHLSAKNRKPHESITSPDFSVLSETSSSYFGNVAELVRLINDIKRAIQEFKAEYRDLSEIQSRIDKLKAEIVHQERKIARVVQNVQCVAYREIEQEINILNVKIITDNQTLSRSQSQYLEKFYEKIDQHFKSFGSNNFTLERETDNRGHQPVYYLKINFHGVEINESNIGKVLSESDRRALGLSVFWAKIDLMDEDQKRKAIIILDDPITSFDDNRILLSISLFKKTLRSVTQIIFLTHYAHFIRIFCERAMNDDFTPAFIEIDQNNTSSFLKRIERNQFTETSYEKAFNKIQAFINREHQEDIRSDLRPFLESQYIPHFYIDKLRQAKNNGVPCGNLNEKIDAIFDGDNGLKMRFHQFRTTLNPDSHFFTSNNEEDIRSFARDMMSFLYNFNYD